MPAKRILFLAKPQSLTPLFSYFKEAGIEAGLAENLAGALDYISKSAPVMVFSMPSLPGYKVESLLARADEEHSLPPVIVFTPRGSAEEAQRYMELGARDYWLEPLAWEKIKAVLPADGPDQEPVATTPTRAADAKQAAGLRIIGDHPAVRRVLALSRQVAPSKASVLISGESGTGKEMFAKYLHAHSDRAEGPFVAINCAALPEHLLESELFGHEKGAFTGAISRKLGRFELANGGSLLLDEISEMDMGLQAKLLRVLQESEIDRVGGTETVKVDVRVLATTNRDIDQSVADGEFRQDLFFRLNVIPLKLPALRERGDDVMLLAQYFADNFCKVYGLPRLSFASDATTWMKDYQWPGNVRELQNLMERAVLLAGNGPIAQRHFLLDAGAWPLDEDGEEEAGGDAAEEPGAVIPGEGSLEDALGRGNLRLDEIEKIAIMKRLEQTSGNRTQAAELLGISVRTLRNKIAQYRQEGLDIE